MFRERRTHTSKGCGFVTMHTREQAIAVSALHRTGAATACQQALDHSAGSSFSNKQPLFGQLCPAPCLKADMQWLVGLSIGGFCVNLFCVCCTPLLPAGHGCT